MKVARAEELNARYEFGISSILVSTTSISSRKSAKRRTQVATFRTETFRSLPFNRKYPAESRNSVRAGCATHPSHVSTQVSCGLLSRYIMYLRFCMWASSIRWACLLDEIFRD